MPRLHLGAAAVACLVGPQAFVFVPTHRTPNAGLAAATVPAVVLVVRAVGAVFATAEQLRVAERDSFDSAAEERVAAYERRAEPPFSGDLFGREFRNITFPGERAGAVEAFRRRDTRRSSGRGTFCPSASARRT